MPRKEKSPKKMNGGANDQKINGATYLFSSSIKIFSSTKNYDVYKLSSSETTNNYEADNYFCALFLCRSIPKG
jgi:hypothetical protein